RDAERVQPRQPLRPDQPAAHRGGPRRPRQHRRLGPRGPGDGGRVLDRRRRSRTGLGRLHLLRRPAARPAAAAAGPVRHPPPRCPVKPIGRAGLLRGGIFFLLLALVPVLGAPGWLLTTLIFTVMYAGLASSWNLIGG